MQQLIEQTNFIAGIFLFLLIKLTAGSSLIQHYFFMPRNM